MVHQGKLMRKHLTEVHGHDFNLKEGMFGCEKCDKKFRTFDILTKHIKVINLNCCLCVAAPPIANSREFMNQSTSLATSAPNWSRREHQWSIISSIISSIKKCNHCSNQNFHW